MRTSTHPGGAIRPSPVRIETVGVPPTALGSMAARRAATFARRSAAFMCLTMVSPAGFRPLPC